MRWNFVLFQIKVIRFNKLSILSKTLETFKGEFKCFKMQVHLLLAVIILTCSPHRIQSQRGFRRPGNYLKSKIAISQLSQILLSIIKRNTL